MEALEPQRELTQPWKFQVREFDPDAKFNHYPNTNLKEGGLAIQNPNPDANKGITAFIKKISSKVKIPKIDIFSC